MTQEALVGQGLISEFSQAFLSLSCPVSPAIYFLTILNLHSDACSALQMRLGL